MDPVAIVLTASGVIGAVITIATASKKVGKILSIRIGRYAVNHIREQDLDPESMVGKGFAFNNEIIKTLKESNAIMEYMRNDINRNHTDSLRVELLQLIHNTPEKAEIIEQVFDNYVKNGGNSYMLQVVEEWRKVYGGEVIRRRITKKTR
ncbi:hypothetical protein LJC07_04810 [Christensenellaceae bacterium OttesenSCG-928-L17]|nr:hypothetical protein [Christensenellaceae bacterium OttesenSCG-928-L17]